MPVSNQSLIFSTALNPCHPERSLLASGNDLSDCHPERSLATREAHRQTQSKDPSPAAPASGDDRCSLDAARFLARRSRNRQTHSSRKAAVCESPARQCRVSASVGVSPVGTTLVLLLTSLWSIGLFGQTETFKNAARHLGRGGDDFARVQLLAKNPASATGLLISELRVIHDTRIPADKQIGDAEHVLWAIRALRFITGGKDICAPTQYHFGKSEQEQNRRYWLTFRSQQCLEFFAMWPSRSIDYVAPADVQEQIISRWGKWYETEGGTYRYRPLVNPKPEDWLW
jgi:hypothetical protein